MARALDVVFPGLVTQPIQAVELVAAAALAAVLLARPAWLRPLGRLWRRVERRPATVLGALAAGLLLAHVTLEWNTPRRAPATHDEFGYLLSAATFTEGRLSNPTPPAWRSLEAMHVNFVPRYTSMYPPGQPAVLAAAWRCLGEPVYANWALAPLLALSTWWMLAAWLPRRWALLGGALVGLRLGLFGYWAESYMTGALPGLGAQVFAGALHRFIRAPTAGLGVAAGAGIAAMFAARPFEAVVLAVCSTAVPWLMRDTATVGRLAWRVLPGAVVFATLVACVAAYNAATTGDPLRFGYDLNMERHGYGVFPGGRTAGGEVDATPHAAAFYEETRRYAAYGWTPGGFIGTRLRNVGWTWVYLLGPLLTLGVGQWPRAVAMARLRPALPGLASCAALVLLNPWPFPHYYAGAFGFLVALALAGMRLWSVRHRVPGTTAAGATLAVAGLVLAIRVGGGEATVATTAMAVEWLPYHTPRGLEQRRTLERDIGADGAALVFVRYGAEAPIRRDWVYNAPDPTRARVVWADDLGPAANARAADAYPGRRAHCLTVGRDAATPSSCDGWFPADSGPGH